MCSLAPRPRRGLSPLYTERFSRTPPHPALSPKGRGYNGTFACTARANDIVNDGWSNVDVMSARSHPLPLGERAGVRGRTMQRAESFRIVWRASIRRVASAKIYRVNGWSVVMLFREIARLVLLW